MFMSSMLGVILATLLTSSLGCVSVEEAHERAKAAAVGNYCQCTDTCHGKPSNYAGYRCDCSGLVSYAWKLGKPGLVTSEMPAYCDKVGWDDLRTGDAILNPAEHVEFFQMWIDKKAGIFHTSACHDVAEGCNTKRQHKSYFEANFYPCRPKANVVCRSENETPANATVRNVHPATYIAKLWKEAASAGFNGAQVTNCHDAVAVALAESGGGCQAKNVNSGGSIDRGLWQINNYWHKEVSDSCAYDCHCNAKAAYKISNKGADWHQWATFTSGAYKSHLEVAIKACKEELVEEVLV